VSAEVSCSEYDQTHRLGMTFDELQALHAAPHRDHRRRDPSLQAEGAEDLA
jgi:hypothetical protein